LAISAVTLMASCALDRSVEPREQTPRSIDAGTDEEDAGGDAGPLPDAGEGCVPSEELCDGVDNDCDPTTPDGADDPRLRDACDADADDDLCVDDDARCVGAEIVCVDVDGDLVEICLGGDEDCDGIVDEDGAYDATPYYVDADGDGAGDESTVMTSCDPLVDRVTLGGDCDDTRADLSPTNDELCSRFDEDCDGRVDEGDVCPCRRLAFEGSDYLLCSTPREYGDAESACQALGWHLAKLDTAEETGFLAPELPGSSWIGLDDREDDRTFVWFDGSDGGHRPWAEDEPNDGGVFGDEDCVELRTNGELNDLRCRDDRGYVCEREIPAAHR